MNRRKFLSSTIGASLAVCAGGAQVITRLLGSSSNLKVVDSLTIKQHGMDHDFLIEKMSDGSFRAHCIGDMVVTQSDGWYTAIHKSEKGVSNVCFQRTEDAWYVDHYCTYVPASGCLTDSEQFMANAFFGTTRQDNIPRGSWMIPA